MTSTIGKASHDGFVCGRSVTDIAEVWEEVSGSPAVVVKEVVLFCQLAGYGEGIMMVQN